MRWRTISKQLELTITQHIERSKLIRLYLLLFQKQDGHMQRFIREVNTTSRACVLWELEEETDYIVQVQSIGLYGESQASKRVHFRTLKKSDRFPSNSSNQGIVFTCGKVFKIVCH